MQIITADSRSRVTLGVRLARPGQNFRVEISDEGVVTLTPVLIVDEDRLTDEERAVLTRAQERESLGQAVIPFPGMLRKAAYKRRMGEAAGSYRDELRHEVRALRDRITVAARFTDALVAALRDQGIEVAPGATYLDLNVRSA